MIGAEGPSQANICGKLSCSGQYDGRGMLSLMLGSFPAAEIETFAVTDDRGSEPTTWLALPWPSHNPHVSRTP